MKELLNYLFLMDTGEIFFLASIVFQVCGALILLLNSFRGTKGQIVGLVFASDNNGELTHDDYLKIDFWTVFHMLQIIYLNRASFILIAVGYIFAIWSDIGNFSKGIMLELVAISCVSVFILTHVIVVLFSLLFSNIHKHISAKYVPKGTVVKKSNGIIKTKNGEEIESVTKYIKK